MPDHSLGFVCNYRGIYGDRSTMSFVSDMMMNAMAVLSPRGGMMKQKSNVMLSTGNCRGLQGNPVIQPFVWSRCRSTFGTSSFISPQDWLSRLGRLGEIDLDLRLVLKGMMKRRRGS